MNIYLLFPIISSFLALAFGGVLAYWVQKQPQGGGKQVEIAKAIQEGASAFLSRQYWTIFYIAVLLAVLLYWFLGVNYALGFLIGAFFSSLAGYVGMNVSVRANIRTAEAGKKGLNSAFNLAFRGGAVTGFMVVGLSLLSVAGFYAITKDVGSLIALGFGGSLISVFARLGGGIFTKAADVGADLVGKVDAVIP